MADEFVSVSQEGWGSRIKNSFGGIIFGVILGIIAFPVLFLNEGRAVKRQQTLEEGAGIVISVGADRVDPALESKLVHVTGEAEVNEELKDEKFGVSATAIRLVREVEMYQWVEDKKNETKNKTGGGTETKTVASYRKDWSSNLVNSSKFEKPEGHQNPDAMPYQGNSWAAEKVNVGVFHLSPELIKKIANQKPLKIKSLDAVPEDLRAGLKLHGGGFFVGGDPGSPEIGDVRIKFSLVTPTAVSVVAKQVGDSFESYRTAAGGELQILAMGTQSAETMFADEESANRMTTWILRGVGLLLMTVGLVLITQPLKVVADVLPLAGRIVGAGLGFISFALAMIATTLTIATAWLFYRPIIGISVLVITLLFVVLAILKIRKAKPPQLNMPVGASGESPPPL